MAKNSNSLGGLFGKKIFERVLSQQQQPKQPNYYSGREQFQAMQASHTSTTSAAGGSISNVGGSWGKIGKISGGSPLRKLANKLTCVECGGGASLSDVTITSAGEGVSFLCEPCVREVYKEIKSLREEKKKEAEKAAEENQDPYEELKESDLYDYDEEAGF